MWAITDWLWQSNRESVRRAAANGDLGTFDRIYAVTEVPLGLPDEYHWPISDDGEQKDYRELAALIRDALGSLKVKMAGSSPSAHSSPSRLERNSSREGRSRLLVYCEAGVRRSSMVCLALLCGLSGPEATNLFHIEEAQKAIVKANPVAAFPPKYVDTVLKALRSVDST